MGLINKALKKQVSNQYNGRRGKSIITGLDSKDFPDRISYIKARKKKYAELYEQRIGMKLNQKYYKTPNGIFHLLKNSSAQRGIEFNLTFDEFITFWQKPCHYCGSGIDVARLDRIDSLKGYSFNNVVSCCTMCNYAKSDNSKEVFLEYLERVYQFLKKQKGL